MVQTKQLQRSVIEVAEIIARQFMNAEASAAIDAGIAEINSGLRAELSFVTDTQNTYIKGSDER